MSKKETQKKTQRRHKKKLRKDRRMTSIARKINWLWIWKQVSIYLSMDILILLLAIICWCIGVQIETFGKVSFQIEFPIFSSSGGISKIMYHAVSATGKCVDKEAGLFFQMLLGCAAIVGGCQVIALLRSIIFDARAIRHQLHPLNELAKKAEQISSIAFDEDKYRILEDAICRVHPEDGDEHLVIGDEDLQGLELAVNNLIDRMKESYRQQSRFVSDASHELRTPISVIQGYVNMLDRWGKEDETILEESIDALKQESEHMAKLVEQLLFLARSDSGRNRITMEKVNLGEILQEVYEESIMIDENHNYFYDVPAQNCEVFGDVTMLKQTVRILVENAAKYTSVGEDIRFRVGHCEEGVYFSVQDTGVGMQETDVVHMFERFYRSDEVRNSKTGGSGLGLSIAKWIVDKHKGHFDILSRKQLGTRITVYFPPYSDNVANEYSKIYATL